MFQARHFEKIAEILRNLESVSPEEQARVIEAFANGLAPTNPRFDSDRFVAACNK